MTKLYRLWTTQSHGGLGPEAVARGFESPRTTPRRGQSDELNGNARSSSLGSSCSVPPRRTSTVTLSAATLSTTTRARCRPTRASSRNACRCQLHRLSNPPPAQGADEEHHRAENVPQGWLLEGRAPGTSPCEAEQLIAVQARNAAPSRLPSPRGRRHGKGF